MVGAAFGVGMLFGSLLTGGRASSVDSADSSVEIGIEDTSSAESPKSTPVLGDVGEANPVASSLSKPLALHFGHSIGADVAEAWNIEFRRALRRHCAAHATVADRIEQCLAPR